MRSVAQSREAAHNVAPPHPVSPVDGPVVAARRCADRLGLQARSFWRIPGDLGSLYHSWLRDVACRLVPWSRSRMDLVFGPARRPPMSFLVLSHLRDRHRDAKGDEFAAGDDSNDRRVLEHVGVALVAAR